MASGFLPDKDAELLAWASNFSTLITATPTTYGLVAAQATAFAGALEAYSTALTASTDPGTRTRVNVLAKNAAKAQLKTLARSLAKTIDGTASVTDSQRAELGLNVRKQPSPIPAPEFAPKIDIESVIGRTVTIRLHEGDVAKRAKPTGVAGASVFSYVGATPPADPAAWKFEGNTSRTTFTATFTGGTAAETVWFTAFWYNPRGMSGPGTLPPMQANLPAAASLPVTAQLKVAA